jgi:hypothetical protein
MKTISVILTVILTIFLTGCTGMKIEDFNGKTPKFIPQEYFNGKLKAYGLVKDRSGNIIRTFKCEMYGSWDQNGIGSLKEDFIYDDGETQSRTWKLVPQKDGSFEATAQDVIGTSKMVVNGNTVMLDYILRVPYRGSTLDINVQDWLHLQEDGVILNHSKMKKFGFVVGELVITIIKQ